MLWEFIGFIEYSQSIKRISGWDNCALSPELRESIIFITDILQLIQEGVGECKFATSFDKAEKSSPGALTLYWLFHLLNHLCVYK